MLYSDFQNLVCVSADLYLNYLANKRKAGSWETGSKVIPVHEITPGRIPREHVLFTNERVLRPDECQIQYQGKEIRGIEILKTQTINKFTHAVHIADRLGNFEKLFPLSPNDIHIVSDLTFLIRRLRQFYENNRFSLSGSPPITVPPLAAEYTKDLSQEQLETIAAVFRSPISYISGAPGTGKTRAVLARCILRYVLANKRVFLLAPTNNAVEQMLRGVLPILNEAGIDLTKVYRLGTATEGFAQEYPQVIGDTAAETQINSLLSQKAHYQSQINEFKRFQKQAVIVSKRIEKCTAVHAQVTSLAIQLRETCAHISDLDHTVSKLSEQAASAKAKYKEAEDAEAKAAAVVTSCENSISTTQGQIKRLKLLFWKSKSRHQLEDDLRLLLINLTQYRTAHKDTLSIRKEACSQYKSASQAHADCLNKYNQETKRHDALIERIRSLSHADHEYEITIEEAIRDGNYVFDNASYFIDDLISQHKDLVAKADEDLYRNCATELELIEKQLSNIGTNAKVLQKENALILAGTIDSSLGELGKPKQKIYHVFLDEAGYTCLAKGMAAFACGAPVTFLGDHKQLPPVCELDPIRGEYIPVILWSLPVAYYSELINLNFEDLYSKCYVKKEDPHFHGIGYHSLNTSYRFGHKLANILAQHVYSSKFHGISDAPFEIQIINAPFAPGNANRSSLSEAEAIRAYLGLNPDLDVAVLAPYRDQIKLLRRTLPNKYKECILTVHRSQGCEWDTVILSVTDNSHPFFTNSKLPIGRSVINTAISRAKRRLVIVCDTNTWKKKAGQMIADLIEAGIILETA